MCENTKESYACKCYDGYMLNDDMVTCSSKENNSVANASNRWPGVVNRQQTKLQISGHTVELLKNIYDTGNNK